ncbi:MAG: hypothetical protein ACOYNO_07015 [Saprospiraceae bacterium]|jgi:hypothetical protein
MKKCTYFLAGFFLFALVFGNAACSQKSGCPATESLQPKTNRNGDLKASKKKDDGLFPKKMSKKM